MRKIVISTLAASIFFSATCSAVNTGACYIRYGIQGGTPVTRCYDDYRYIDCKKERERTTWLLSQKYEGKTGYWVLDPIWYDGLRCTN